MRTWNSQSIFNKEEEGGDLPYQISSITTKLKLPRDFAWGQSKINRPMEIVEGKETYSYVYGQFISDKDSHAD